MKRLAHLLATLLLGLAVAVSASTASPAQGSAVGTAARASYGDFVGVWVGHTRHLRIRADHTARAVIYDGCCTHVITVKYRTSHPRGDRQRGSLRARVTRVRIFADGYYGPGEAPQRGDVGRFRFRHGVLHDPHTGTTYCGPKAGQTGVCGA
ncbi:MAG TPA: hypothetical protein VNS55_00650 [Nocardioides sp.]|nr:hypothetical protein [Nocardioides sp.]